MGSSSDKLEQPPESKQRPTLLTPGFSWSEFSLQLAFWMPVFCLLIALIEGSSYLWRPIAIFLYIILFLAGLFFAFIGLLLDADEKHGNETELVLTVVGLLAALVGFSQASRHVYLLVGGFISEQAGYWHWLRFGISELLESILFDIPAIYEWNISEIRATSTWSRTGIFIFRTALEFLIIAAILRQVRIAWNQRNLVSIDKKQYQNYFEMLASKIGELILMALWGLPIGIGAGAIVNDGLSIESTWSAIRLGAPVAFGAWVTWHSLHGLGLPRWNKLFATIGIAGGIWLVRETWPAFRAFLGQ